jgi:hypothetical protein
LVKHPVLFHAKYKTVVVVIVTAMVFADADAVMGALYIQLSK